MKKLFLLVFLLNFLFCYADSQLDEELINAAGNGDVKKVEELIKQGANVNAIYVNGETVLMYAAGGGNKEIFNYLIKNGADINAKNNDGVTALMKASVYGYTEIIKILIKNKADINARDNVGFTALMFASSVGHKEVVELLLKNKADINAKCNDGWTTALMFASSEGHKEIVEILKKAGAKELVKATICRWLFCNNGGYVNKSCIDKMRITFLNESYKRVTSITFNLEIKDVNGFTLYKKKHTVSVNLDHEEQDACDVFWLSSSVYSSYNFDVPENHTFNVEVLSFE